MAASADSRFRGTTIFFHAVVQQAQVLADVVDGDPGHSIHLGTTDIFCQRGRRGLKAGNALAQDGDKIPHDMDNRAFDAKQIGIQIVLGDAIANLSLQPGIELVFRDRFQDGAMLVRGGVFDVLRHVDGLRGDGDFVDALPAKTGLHSPLILIHGVKTCHNVAQHKPAHKANDNTDGDPKHS